MTIDEPSAVTVSVLVPTRNRPQDLERCVESLLNNDHPAFEIIIIDQSDDGFDADLPDDPRIDHLRVEGKGKSRALNHAIMRARGQVLLFTDDDCTVPTTWITAAAVQVLEDQDVGLVCGALIPAPHDWETEWIPPFEPTERLRLTGKRAFRESTGRAGANMAMPRHLARRIGGFDEELGPGSRFLSVEEFDLTYRILREGYAVIIDPDNEVIHWGTRSWLDGSAQKLLRGYLFGEGAVLAKHIRCGDRFLLRDLVRATRQSAVFAAESSFRKRRPSGFGRITSMWQGFFQGMRQPLDPSMRLFRDRRKMPRLS